MCAHFTQMGSALGGLKKFRRVAVLVGHHIVPHASQGSHLSCAVVAAVRTTVVLDKQALFCKDGALGYVCIWVGGGVGLVFPEESHCTPVNSLHLISNSHQSVRVHTFSVSLLRWADIKRICGEESGTGPLALFICIPASNHRDALSFFY